MRSYGTFSFRNYMGLCLLVEPLYTRRISRAAESCCFREDRQHHIRAQVWSSSNSIEMNCLRVCTRIISRGMSSGHGGYRLRVFREFVAAPRYVQIRSHEQQITSIDIPRSLTIDRERVERRAQLLERTLQLLSCPRRFCQVEEACNQGPSDRAARC